MAAPLLAAAGITAGASLVSGLISARQRKKERQEAKRQAKAAGITETGKQKQKVLSDLIGNLRASLVR